MRDVLARLMDWMATSDIDDADIVLRDAITEIAGLRARLHEHRLAIRRLAEQDATLSVQGGNVSVDIETTLTVAEVEAVRWAVSAARNVEHPAEDTLRDLLGRCAIGHQ